MTDKTFDERMYDVEVKAQLAIEDLTRVRKLIHRLTIGVWMLYILLIVVGYFAIMN